MVRIWQCILGFLFSGGLWLIMICRELTSALKASVQTGLVFLGWFLPVSKLRSSELQPQDSARVWLPVVKTVSWDALMVRVWELKGSVPPWKGPHCASPDCRRVY